MQVVGTSSMTFQNVWTISNPRNKCFEPFFFLQNIIVILVKMTWRPKNSMRELKSADKTFFFFTKLYFDA